MMEEGIIARFILPRIITYELYLAHHNHKRSGAHFVIIQDW